MARQGFAIVASRECLGLEVEEIADRSGRYFLDLCARIEVEEAADPDGRRLLDLVRRLGQCLGAASTRNLDTTPVDR